MSAHVVLSLLLGDVSYKYESKVTFALPITNSSSSSSFLK